MRIPTRSRALLLCLAAALAACSDSTGSSPDVNAPGNYLRSLSSGGRTRTYELHVPPGWTRGTAAPLLLVFHGAGGGSHDMQLMTGLNAAADAHGFVVAYPGSSVGDWALGCTNCSSADVEGVNDVAFARAVISDVQTATGTAPARVFAAGYSSGAELAQTLGCRAADRVSGIASVAGMLYQPVAASCAPSKPVAALIIHGTADPVYPPGGRTVGGLTSLSLADNVQLWLTKDGCTGASTSTDLPDAAADGTTVTRVAYTGCPAAAPVTLYRVNGGGHTWPSGAATYFPASLGPVSRDINASEVMVGFFAALP